ncbi:TRAP transporter substrate-binding protein [Candidatus Kaiserbacteria bacterium]|nr:TRAP transporter substrate-binding protein [Candidatus Kaiserbacteria bacterium]
MVKVSSLKYLVILAVFVALAVWIFQSVSTPTKSISKTPPVQVKWLIAHEPISLFDRANKVFVDEFNKESDGTIEIHIVGPKDFGSDNGHLLTSEVFKALDGGQVQLATIVVTGLKTLDPKLEVLSLPFLFKSESAAGQVLDGPIGEELLETVNASTTARGLAFTFSGGLMAIQSNSKQIRNLEDLKGLRIGTINGPVAEATLQSFGAITVPLDSGKGSPAINKLLDTYDGIETPYTRIDTRSSSTVPRYVSETNHSFFLTTILASDSFYNSLSAQDKGALVKAARAAAVAEREDSIALKEKNKVTLQERGTTIVTVSADATAAFKAKVVGVYAKFAPLFGADLIQKIQNAQN